VPRFVREANSTKWLQDMIWSTAARLGYQDIFLNDTTAADDDHMPFIRRGVPAVDIIQLDDYPYWHTPEDSIDKVSPRTLAIVGHVLMEALPELEKRSR
jgi:glutaminyl-peptide cyclotransferase